MSFTFSRSSGQRSGGTLADQQHPSEEDDDGKSVEFAKIIFGCNQRCPTVALSPASYTRHRLGTKTGPAAHPLPPTTFDLAAVPHLHHPFPVGIGPHLKEKIAQMFRSKSHRAPKHSKTHPTPKLQPQFTTHSNPMASSAFDEMLRSNQTLYIGGVNETTPVSYHSREVLYSNIPLTSAKPSRPSR
ncbi:hypothetical protein PTTG_27359 [Puccinia triticina 1-1 BBBD Race 1]|uniref:Uncharacterized protein n=1 Tax=Puccinia triticina (isolate 1-1 / race 1 (BBBD)) TaxID=630390 RepID=A0A180GKR4_PUCT1|nr:hypothetical protein PTTG_27359 [Puccinia triticina 1-1 BBBD Race 1]WAR60853.1 hypothetical protein PtB15_13B99 [Puccinia triticina]